ncbi:DNA-3-methyladenine glycosylase I [Bifidobacterium sp. ESL0769]|uniref:DNA-3-methyladenine glycosylase I n=1 Tax=Bifidobacterium sp. ESL0769 TaxID=2983229 RepID=UPI0023F7CAB2|nr:DNA-3-methyladenine glycosylase I [Bifidobacterium sp. ESL0769]WEV68332.1 DNA-3-methyladenine glycosylase I [Bifidobacterium sp. ESL0769]
MSAKRKPAKTASDNATEGAVEQRSDGLQRCWPQSYLGLSHDMLVYHDTEWGTPCYDSQALFERLALEAMQAGLSWNTIINKRKAIDAAFHDFDIERVARMSDEIPDLMQNQAIIRNKRKIEATIHNAQVALNLGMPFADYIWSFAPDGPRVNRPKSHEEVPAVTQESIDMSKAMKKAGFKFVGPTTMYAYMQSMGIVNDHLQGCFRCPEAKTD